MDLKQLSYFVAIAEEGNISAAAKKLHISQPPLSTQLRLLEEELGTALVERGPRRATLTDAGRLLYKRACNLLMLADHTVRELEELAGGGSGALRLGTISSSGTALLDRRLPEFHRRYPGVRFELHEGNTYQLLELLGDHVIELAVVRTPFPSEGLELCELPPEPMAAAGLPKFLGQTGEALGLSELNALPLIIYRRFEALLSGTLQEAGLEPRYFCKSDDARTCLLWARAGLGVAVVPESAVAMIGDGMLCSRPIACEKLYTQLAAIHRAGVPLSSAAQNFLEIFMQTG